MRHKALLESVMFTFLQLNGAMRSSQLPHLVEAQGIVAYASKLVPAPTISPLNGDYVAEIQGISSVLNKLRPDSVTVRQFTTLSGLAAILQELVETTTPYKFPV
jgi:CRISPR-associated protein Cst2